MEKFEQPDFKKDNVRELLEKLWLAGRYEFKKLNRRVSALETDYVADKVKVANLNGKVTIIIGLLLAIAAGVFIPLMKG